MATATAMMILAISMMLFARSAQAQVNWCATAGKERDGVTELQKCNQLVAVMNAAPGTAAGTYACVEAADCEVAVRDGTAHAFTMDGGGIFASRVWGGVPLVAESTSTTSASATYYTVAVVKSSFCTETVSLASLRGKRSCHTGYRKSAGWRFPLTTLMKSGLATLPSTQNCGRANDVEVLESFFTSACAPGTVKDSPLCSNCAGAKNPLDVDGEAWCKKDVDPYAGYGGAFKCLAAGAGDVAFVKHTTVASESSESWFTAASHSTNDFKLLCRGGGCADVGDWANCYWAKVPAHAVIVNVNTLGYTLRAKLNQDLMAASLTPAFAALFYTTGGFNPNPGSLVFKSGTAALVDTLGQDIREYFGDTYGTENKYNDDESAYRWMRENIICDDDNASIDLNEKLTHLFVRVCVSIYRELRVHRRPRRQHGQQLQCRAGGAPVSAGGRPERARRQGRRQGRRTDGRGHRRGRRPRRAHAVRVHHDWQGAQRAADVHEDLG